MYIEYYLSAHLMFDITSWKNVLFFQLAETLVLQVISNHHELISFHIFTEKRVNFGTQLLAFLLKIDNISFIFVI